MDLIVTFTFKEILNVFQSNSSKAQFFVAAFTEYDSDAWVLTGTVSAN